MKIFELNTFCGAGSTGRIALDIAQYASAQGAEAMIGFGAGNIPPEAETYALRIGSPVSRKWHGALRKLLDAEGYGSALATRRLIDFLTVYRPDVIHLHNLHGCYLNHRILFRYLKRAGVPVLWTLHDCWPFTGHCAYFDYVGCHKWRTLCHHCPQQSAYPVCVGLDGSRRNFRHRRELFTEVPNLTLVTPCQWLKETVAASFLRETPCRVIYNGVNRDVFKPTPSDIRQKFGIQQRYLVLAVASEWEERKGLRYLLEAADRLGPEYRVAVLGLTEEQRMALPAPVLGLPRTTSVTELAAWYSAADCLANPTMEDNMPMVNLEALACGTPVVVFATGGCPEAVDATCGAVVPKGDAVALANASEKTASQKAALQAACLQRAEAFDSQRSTAGYWSLYQEVLS